MKKLIHYAQKGKGRMLQYWERDGLLITITLIMNFSLSNGKIQQTRHITTIGYLEVRDMLNSYR